MQPRTQRRAVRRPSRKQERDSYCRELLDAAEQVFGERGLDGTHMSHIAARAGVATGTLYNYFEDREALLGALVESNRNACVEAMGQSVKETAGQPFRSRLVALLKALLGVVDEHHGLLLVILRAEDEQCAHPAPRGRGQRTFDVLETYLVAMVKQAVRRRELSPGGAPLYPTLLTGQVWALINRGVRRTGVLASEADRIAALFLDGAGA